MLAEQVDHVIGVDTHRDSHSAAVLNTAGALQAQTTLATDAFGYRRLLAFARESAPGRRCWAIEGTGSYGSGLTSFLLEHGEWVVEIDRPKRPARRNGAKSDELDAVRAAREALSREYLAQSRQRGWREAMRVLLTTREGAMLARTKAIVHLKALLVWAPTSLRDQLRRHPTNELVTRCSRLRTSPTQTVEHRATITAMRATARRALTLEAEAADMESQLESLLVEIASHPNCCKSAVSDRSVQHNYSSPTHTPDGCVQRPPSPPSQAPRRYQHPPDKRFDTALIAAVIASSTGHYTRSPSPA